MPLYIVSTGEGEAKAERLVEANNKAVARNFVARDMVSVELAGQADLFRLAKAGKNVEVATDQPQIDEGGGASGGGVETPEEPDGDELQPEEPPVGDQPKAEEEAPPKKKK